jgi:hypothetical protein
MIAAAGIDAPATLSGRSRRQKKITYMVIADGVITDIWQIQISRHH